METNPPCPVCQQRGGFHGNECTDYRSTSKETRPPGREAFEAWLAEYRANRRSDGRQ